MAFMHSAQLLYTDCGYPRWTVCFTMPNAVFFYLLFNDFYKKSYNKPIVVKTSEKKNGQLTNGTTSSRADEKAESNNNESGSLGDNKRKEE